MLIFSTSELFEKEGFGEEPWSSSQVMSFVSEQPGAVHLPDAIWVSTGRNTWSVPSSASPWTRRENESLPSEVERMLAKVVQEGGAIVLFDEAQRSYLVDETYLVNNGFDVMWRTDEAVALGAGDGS